LIGTVSASASPQSLIHGGGASNSASGRAETSFAMVLGAKTEPSGSANVSNHAPTESLNGGQLGSSAAKDAASRRKETNRAKQEGVPDLPLNPLSQVPTATPVLDQNAVTSTHALCGADITSAEPNNPDPSSDEDSQSETSLSTAVETKTAIDVLSVTTRAPGNDPLPSLKPNQAEQTPADTKEELRAMANVAEPFSHADAPSPERNYTVEPSAHLSGHPDGKLTANYPPESISAIVTSFAQQSAPQLKPQSPAAAMTVRSTPPPAAAILPTIPSAAAGSPAGSPDRQSVLPDISGQQSTEQSIAPVQAIENEAAVLPVAVPASGSSRSTTIPVTAKSKAPGQVTAGTPGPRKESARPQAPQSGCHEADNTQDSDSLSGNIAPLSQESQVPASAATHPMSPNQVPPSAPIQPAASQEALGLKGTEEKTNGQNALPNSDNSLPQTESGSAFNPSLQSGRILERMGQSEMHVGVRTADFGTIEVHASLNQDRVGASVATTHPDLRTAMEAELPSLQQAIARHQLHLDTFDVASHGGGQSGGNSSDSRSRSYTNGQNGSLLQPGEPGTAAPTPTSAWVSPHASRLSVIA
jgi:hypothetical protein